MDDGNWDIIRWEDCGDILISGDLHFSIAFVFVFDDGGFCLEE